MNKKNRIRLFLLSTLMMFSMCFFFSNTTVKACDNTLQGKIAVGTNIIHFDEDGAGGSDSLPSEITEPIDKGMKLLEYLVITIGIVAIMVGLVLLGLSFWGHQNDLKIASFIALGAGLVILAAPSIAKWLAGR